MPPTPTLERPPAGIADDAYWLGVWRRSLKTLKDRELWNQGLHPLLVEYLEALRASEQAREGFDELLAALKDSYCGEIDWQALTVLSTSLPAAWDKHAKRAAALADALGLSSRGAKAAGAITPAEKAKAAEKKSDDADPFGDLDNVTPIRRGA